MYTLKLNITIDQAQRLFVSKFWLVFNIKDPPFRAFYNGIVYKWGVFQLSVIIIYFVDMFRMASFKYQFGFLVCEFIFVKKYTS